MLHDVAPLSSRDSDVWENVHLSKKLETQLEDAFSICCGTYSPWIDTLIAECKFLFSRELREKFFQATAFGNTRSLHWFRNQFNLDDSSSSSGGDIGGFAGGGIYNHEITISPIPKERVKVHRDKILSSAEAVMKMHSKRKAILDVVFAGEKGYGSGVTASFYSATAQALLSAVVRDPSLRYWIPGQEDPSVEGENSVIRHPNGLFPFPHRDPHQKLVDRFRMMGRLAGKALMDGRLFPLPLSTHFIQLVLGERLSGQYLSSIFSSHGRILRNLKSAAHEIQCGKTAATISVDGLQLEDWLAAASLTFIDPLSQEALRPGGDDEDVTTTNLVEYVDTVERLWLGDGIRAQVNAFRDGIGDVLPVQKLKLLNVSELLALLCGHADIDWNAESLLKTMKLAHGYTKDSPPVRFFVEALEAMPVRERRDFLLYATGCPNLPAGGFAALRPPFEVVRRIVDSDNVDQSLPFARTCTNTLHLPAYSSLDVLKERLHYAIVNSQGVIDRD
ncbi:hypothetical protein PINS_up001328 [Pythium insidiosum]|nr:hypothetical protein PINS_up001328 [Pythium insidiosum]